MLAFGAIIERLRMRMLLSRHQYHAAKAVIAWIRSIADPSTVIRIEFPRYSATLRFSFPLRARDLPRRVRKNVEPPVFIIRPPAPPLGGQWARAFRSPDIEVLEKIKHERGLTPIRFGLSHEAKMSALRFVRDAMEESLEKRPAPQRGDIPSRFLLSADVNVALWVAGALRGSQIVEGHSLKDGLAEAARRVLVDARFKPIMLEELRGARIQIGILHPLRVPLSKRTLKHNRILPEKGYLLSHNGKKGWFLPEVLNVRKFRGLDELLADLAREKTGIDPVLVRADSVRIFEVEDFIESEDRLKPIRLYGPMCEPEIARVDGEREKRFRAAADWLVSIQEADGNIPPIVDALTGRSAQIDWPRLAFTAWSLSEYGAAARDNSYRASAEKVFAFLRNHFLEIERSIPQYELTLAYFGRLALSLRHTGDAQKAAFKLIENNAQPEFDPIVFAQVAGFLRQVRVAGADDLASLLEAELKRRFRDFRRGHAPMGLAMWAELAPLFGESDPVFSEEVYEWILAQQLESGAFPDSTSSDFTYSRGTGKIVEVLASKKGKYKAEIAAALAWLFSMQYDRETMFFVPPEIRPTLHGSFRHDYMNQDAWIDAAGHILIGAALLTRTP